MKTLISWFARKTAFFWANWAPLCLILFLLSWAFLTPAYSVFVLILAFLALGPAIYLSDEATDPRAVLSFAPFVPLGLIFLHFVALAGWVFQVQSWASKTSLEFVIMWILK